MDNIVVANLALEGGGPTVFGRQEGDHWVFWREGTSISLDANDEEVWRSWATEPVAKPSAAVPTE